MQVGKVTSSPDPHKPDILTSMPWSLVGGNEIYRSVSHSLQSDICAGLKTRPENYSQISVTSRVKTFVAAAARIIALDGGL